MTNLQMLGNSFCEFDLVPLFDPKVHLNINLEYLLANNLASEVCFLPWGAILKLI